MQRIELINARAITSVINCEMCMRITVSKRVDRHIKRIIEFRIVTSFDSVRALRCYEGDISVSDIKFKVCTN